MKKLFLLFILFTSFAGIRAMANTQLDEATALQLLHQVANIDPTLNVNSQTLLTGQSKKMIWAKMISKSLIKQNIIGPDNQLIQNFNNAKNNAKQAMSPISPQIGKHNLTFIQHIINNEKLLTENQKMQIQQAQQQIGQSQEMMQAINSINTVSSNENVQSGMEAFINDLPILLNQINNNQNDS